MHYRAAILFDRLGPYHCARLSAASARLSIDAIEVFGRSKVYAWEPVDGPGPFRRITLFPDRDNRSASNAEIRAGVAEQLGRARPDVVFVHGWSEPSALAALAWAHTTGTAAVVMSETPAQAKARWSWKEGIKALVVRLFSAALVGGGPQAEYLASLGMPKDRIFTGYNAVDNDYFARGAADARRREQELRSRLGLEKPFFLCAARFVPEKNLDGLIRAYAGYRRLCSEMSRRSAGAGESSGVPRAEALRADKSVGVTGLWDLVLLGDGPLRGSLAALRSALGLTGCVHFTGFKQYRDLPAYYGLASAFVLPSAVEPWGLVVNEAMASGLPVLVSNRCGCAPDLVKEGCNGFTFDPDDEDALASLFSRIASTSDQQRAEMSEAGRRIVGGFGPETFASGVEKATHAALNAPVPRGAFSSRALLWLLQYRPCPGSIPTSRP